jgi:hypothetical protein
MVANPKPSVKLSVNDENQNPNTRPIKIIRRKNKKAEIMIQTNEPKISEEDRMAFNL